MRVLIADDEPVYRSFIRRLLATDSDVNVVGEALDGEEAVSLSERLKPDVVIMDLDMPGTNGLEATRRLKANAALKHIPIIALSAHAMMGDAEKALQSGCDDYLSKPLDEDLLFEKLRQFLGESPQR